MGAIFSPSLICVVEFVSQTAFARKACVFSSHSQVKITKASLSKAKEKPRTIKLASLVRKFSIVHLRKVMNSCMCPQVPPPTPPDKNQHYLPKNEVFTRHTSLTPRRPFSARTGSQGCHIQKSPLSGKLLPLAPLCALCNEICSVQVSRCFSPDKNISAKQWDLWVDLLKRQPGEVFILDLNDGGNGAGRSYAAVFFFGSCILSFIYLFFW